MEQALDREHLVHDDREREHIAAAVERLAEDLLGDMYAFLPLTVPVRVRELAPRALAMPKSRTFTRPSPHTMMFGGETSRWTTLRRTPSGPRASCAAWRPRTPGR